jgi:hypothetical protein
VINLENWVIASWAMAAWMFFSVLLSPSDNFSALNRSKLKWFLLSLAALFPYLGGVIVLAYLFMVRRHFPKKPSALAQGVRAAGLGAGGTVPVNKPWDPGWEKCSCSDGKVECPGCQGRGWFLGSPGEPNINCHMCTGGIGYCQRCAGTGRRHRN